MAKNLEYYLKLKYPIQINPIPEEEGGGYEACIPQLGKYAFVGDGETIEEALRNLKEIKKDYFKDYLKKGIKIPEPKLEEEDYSGKFVIRLPRFLHKHLAEQAKKNNVSLNYYINVLLSMNNPIYELQNLKQCYCREMGYLISQYRLHIQKGTKSNVNEKESIIGPPLVA